MKFTIKKIGHSCVTYERDGVKILVDPGGWTENLDLEKGISLVLITHTHTDHLDLPRLKLLLGNNPDCVVRGNQEVVDHLKAESIEATLITGTMEWSGIRITVVGLDHATIYPSLPGLSNTGFLFDEVFYHPGDALTVPDIHPKVLALPIIAPWTRLSEALDFAIACKPIIAFPIHDGMLKHFSGGQRQAPTKVLGDANIQYAVIEDGSERTFEF